MSTPRTVTREVWLEHRLELLANEKAFDRARDALAEERRALPRVKIDKAYAFEGPALHGDQDAAAGKRTLAGLFAGRGQLIVYHFMFGLGWEAGCSSCSFWADNFEGIGVHLAQRDVTLVAVSLAPVDQIEKFQRRMGWTFPWYSSTGSDFNVDFHVSFTPEEKTTGLYNYKRTGFPRTEAPGVSVFLRDGDDVLHTYSSYARGIDMLNGAYHFLDITPRGRDEKQLGHPQDWIKHHDRY